MYYIFGAFNAAALIHMTLFAPETKGYTLEEMDDVFDSGLPAWKKHQKRSRLEELQREIEAGNLKVSSDTNEARGLGDVVCVCDGKANSID
jgi:ABC-type proline/glycine betaine transport system ATPase subunit